MTKKTLVILIVLAVILTALSFTIIRKTNKSYLYSEQAIGSFIFPNFNLDKIKSIKIIKPDSTVITLDKNQNNWTIQNLYDYPVNNEQLSSLLEEAANLKVIQNVQITPDAYNKLKLTLPNAANDSGGIEIKFLGKKEKFLYSIIIGEKRIEKDIKNRTELTVGRYVKKPDTPDIYLTDELFNCVNFTAEDWLYDHNIAITDIKKIELSKDSNIEWTLSRNKPDDKFLLENTSKYTDINTERIKSIVDSLNNLKFNSVAKNSTQQKKTGLDSPVCLQIQTFNDIEYDLKIGKVINNSRYVKFMITSPSSKILTERQKSLEKLFKEWIYLIDINRLEPLLSSKESLLTTEKYKKAPENIYSYPIS